MKVKAKITICLICRAISVDLIRRRRVEVTSSRDPELKEILYPQGVEFDKNSLRILLEQYKLFVNSSEKLVARRQTVNTFFLSVNALLLSALGMIAREVATMRVALTGIIAIGVAGILLCLAWRKLVKSYRQLNAGKFAVIHLLEQYLPAALFKAEWIALGEGKDKEKYTPFTRTEATIPIVFMVLYGIAASGSLVYLLGLDAIIWKYLLNVIFASNWNNSS